MDDIPTSNRFDALTEEDSNFSTSDDEAEMQQNRSTNLQPPTKKEKISPIVVTNSALSSETKAKIHLNIIKNHVGTTLNFTNSAITIFPKTKKDFESLTSLLTKWNISYHTYATPGQKIKKFVLKGLPLLDEEDISKDIKNFGPIPIQVKRMTAGPKSNADRPLYFVSFEPTIDTKQIRDIKYICAVKIRWENYKNPKQITQCYRSQWFHHGTSHCHRHPRCVKCIKNHLTKDCDKTETEKPQCTNCHKDHPANSRECEIYKQELEKIQLRRRSRTTQHRTDHQILPSPQAEKQRRTPAAYTNQQPRKRGKYNPTRIWTTASTIRLNTSETTTGNQRSTYK